MTAISTTPDSGLPVQEKKHSSPTRIGFIAQLAMAAHFETDPYLDVARDPRATWKVGVLVAAGGASHGALFPGQLGVAAIAVGAAVALCAWPVLGGLVFASLRALGRSVEWAELLRVVGFASFGLVFVAIALTAGETPMLVPSLLGLFYALTVYNQFSAIRRLVQG